MYSVTELVNAAVARNADGGLFSSGKNLHAGYGEFDSSNAAESAVANMSVHCAQMPM